MPGHPDAPHFRKWDPQGGQRLWSLVQTTPGTATHTPGFCETIREASSTCRWLYSAELGSWSELPGPALAAPQEVGRHPRGGKGERWRDVLGALLPTATAQHGVLAPRFYGGRAWPRQAGRPAQRLAGPVCRTVACEVPQGCRHPEGHAQADGRGQWGVCPTVLVSTMAGRGQATVTPALEPPWSSPPPRGGSSGGHSRETAPIAHGPLPKRFSAARLRLRGGQSLLRIRSCSGS